MADVRGVVDAKESFVASAVDVMLRQHGRAFFQDTCDDAECFTTHPECGTSCTPCTSSCVGHVRTCASLMCMACALHVCRYSTNDPRDWIASSWSLDCLLSAS